MVTLLIISDDFTGALDTGVQFAVSGALTRVITDYTYGFDSVDPEVQVLVLDAETRHLSPGEAYKRVYEVVERAGRADIPYIYKKTDSALRGNVGSELTAALKASKAGSLHFFPAFPKMGRITQNGRHFVDEIPVEKSVFGRDPFEPVRCSYIPDIIRSQSDVRVVTAGDQNIWTEDDEPVIAIYDAAADEDLYRLAQRLKESGRMSVMAGCAGMAAVLPELLGLTGEVPGRPVFCPSMLVACGSVNPITKRQLDYAENHEFIRIRLKPEEKLNYDYYEHPEGKRRLSELLNICRRNPFVLLDTNDADDENSTMELAEKRGFTLDEVRIRIADNLGSLVKRLLEAGLEKTLMVTGGDTLLGLMKQMEVSEMQPVCEIKNGIVLAQFTWNNECREIITKSGGFGSESLLAELAETMKNEKRENVVCRKNIS